MDHSHPTGRLLSGACTTCRRKKIRCDTVKPSCAHCAAAGLPCRYADPKKTGLPRGYVRSLEATIEELKQKNKELQNRFSSKHDSSRAPASADVVFSDNVLPSLNFTKTPMTDTSDSEVLMQDPFDSASLIVAELLSPEDRTLLRNIYFSSCHPFIPILHEPTFSFADDEIHVTCSVLALASRQLDQFESKAEIFYSLAKQTTQATLLTPSFSTLISLLLQVVFEIGQPNTSLNPLSTLGSAIALTSAFRLVRLDEEPWRPSTRWLQKPRDWVEEEQRRRTALMVLSLSRWMATIQDREFGVSAKSEVKLVLPVSDEVWFSGFLERPRTDPITQLTSADRNSPFARWVQVIGLYSLVHDYRLSQRNHDSRSNEARLLELNSTLEKFILSFPDECKQVQDIQSEHLLDITSLSLTHTCCLLLHNAPPSTTTSSQHHFSRQRSSAHAEDILDIANSAIDHPELGNYMLPHCHILAARVRLSELLIRRGSYRGRDMDLLMRCLLTFGRRWGLQDKLALHAARIEANDMPFSEPLTTFEPTTNIRELPRQRQKSTSLVRARWPSKNVQDGVDGDSGQSIPTGFSDTVLEEVPGILPVQPMDWSTMIWGIDDENPYI